MKKPKCQRCFDLDNGKSRDLTPPRKVLCDHCLAWYETLPGWRK